jgi:hypothetical protein
MDSYQRELGHVQHHHSATIASLTFFLWPHFLWHYTGDRARGLFFHLFFYLLPLRSWFAGRNHSRERDALNVVLDYRKQRRQLVGVAQRNGDIVRQLARHEEGLGGAREY